MEDHTPSSTLIPLGRGRVSGILPTLPIALFPLSYAQDMQDLGLSSSSIQGPRLRLFCQTYGLEQPYAEILDFVEQRLQAMCSWLSERVIAQDPTRQRLVDEGHLDYYRREIAVFQQHRTLLRSYLTR